MSATMSRPFTHVVALVALIATLVVVSVGAEPVAGAQQIGRLGVDVRQAIDTEGTIEVAVLRTVAGELSIERARVDRHDEIDGLLADPTVMAVERSDKKLVRYLNESAVLIGADVSLANGTDGAGTTVAIVDSGIENTHPDLSSSLVYEACFLELPNGQGLCPGGLSEAFGPGAAPDDDIGHGTLVAGVITSDGVVAPTGIAPEADIEMYKIFDGDNGGYQIDLLLSLDHIVTQRPDVDVVNLSLGVDESYTDDCDDVYTVMFQIVEALRAQNRVVVAASGNNGLDTMGAPACLSNVISVAASGDDVRSAGINEVTSFSNVSTTTDLAAPGDYVQTSWINGSMLEVVGTSFATPAVAACAALLYQVGYRTTAQLETRLRTSSTIAPNPNGPDLPLVDCATGPPPSGDVSCDGVTDIIDALFIAQLTVGVRTATDQCPLNDPATELYAPIADMNASGVTDIVDALVLSQCTVGAPTLWCPLN